MSQTVREVVVAAYGARGSPRRERGLHLTHPVDFTGQLLAGVVRKGAPQLAVSEIDDVVLQHRPPAVGAAGGLPGQRTGADGVPAVPRPAGHRAANSIAVGRPT